MPVFTKNEVRIHFEEIGTGFPVLLFAPGGMRSAIPFWETQPWNPIEVLSPHFRVIAMDQRNAGQSTAPVSEENGWHSYTSDHLALLDHLGIERTHLLGGCIGGPYCMGVVKRASERVAAAVLQQPIGLSSENREAFYEMFDSWAAELRKVYPEVQDRAWSGFRERMYGGSAFLFNVDRDFIRVCPTPLLVLMGNDLYHPAEISREIVDLAPKAELVEQWQDPDTVGQAVERVLRFLREHTP